VAKDLEVIDDDESFRVSLSSLAYGADGYASAEDYIGSLGLIHIAMSVMLGFPSLPDGCLCDAVPDQQEGDCTCRR
jgi:hypothetical protein